MVNPLTGEFLEEYVPKSDFHFWCFKSVLWAGYVNLVYNKNKLEIQTEIYFLSTVIDKYIDKKTNLYKTH